MRGSSLAVDELPLQYRIKEREREETRHSMIGHATKVDRDKELIVRRGWPFLTIS